MTLDTLELVPHIDARAISLENEIVLYDHRAEEALVLNDSAAYMWESFDGTRTISMVADDLAQDFVLDYQAALVAVQEFADQLQGRGLLIPASLNPTYSSATVLEKQRITREHAALAAREVRKSRLKESGLAEGALAPAFTLPDLDGTPRSLGALRGGRVLLVFWDPASVPCQAVAPQLVRIDRDRDIHYTTVVMVSRGDPARNRARADEHGFLFPILLQQDVEVCQAYLAADLPVSYVLDEESTLIASIGYLVDEQGKILRGVAVGAREIGNLCPG